MSSRILKKTNTLADRIRTTLTEASSLLDDENTPWTKLQGTMASLETYSTRLQALLAQLDDLSCDATQGPEVGEPEDPFTLVLDCDEVLANLKVRLTSIEHTRNISTLPLTSSNEQTNPEGQQNVRLPKLVMPTFDGDFLKWQEFWDAFDSSVHSNNSLTPVDKFNYLNSLLIGEAKLCISGLSLTSQNYETAISLLKNRFANKSIIINSHFKALMEIPTIKIDTTKALRHRMDLIEKHLRCLQSMGENTESSYVLTLITSKLPLNVLLKVEEQNLGKEMTVKLLCSTINNILFAREKSELLLRPSKVGSVDVLQLPTYRLDKDVSSEAKGRTSTAQALASSARTNQAQHCIFCEGDHWSDMCTTFTTVSDRKGKIKGVCFVCLKKGHSLKNCKVSKPCVYCKQRKNHHRSLCPKQFLERSNQTTTQLNPNETSLVIANERVILQTVTVQVTNPDIGLKQTARLLFDTGSQRSYVSKSLASKLQLKSDQNEILNVFTFGNKSSKTLETQIVTFGITVLDGDTFFINANVVPYITGQINSSNLIDINKIKQMYHALVLAEGQDVNWDIDILIGNDYYFDFMSSKKIEIRKGLYLIGTKLGWVVSGRTDNMQDKTHPYSTSFLTAIHPTNFFQKKRYFESSDPQMVTDLCVKNFWSLESLGIHDCPFENDDDLALSQFNENVKLEDGRYSVGWPWKEYPPNLPSNYGLSMGRLKSLLSRLESKPKVLQEYDKVIQDQITRDIIEKVPDDSNSVVKHYIPHHPIINESKPTTKLRIVYDASAKSNKSANSLNDCLYRGPVILEDLCGLLIRFQLNSIGIVADIEKAFLQLNLNKSDRDVTRFLWLKDVSSPFSLDNIQEFRFCRVPFGIISSPFLLSATIKYHLSKNNETDESKTLTTSFYVDNVVTGTTREQEALQLFTFATSLFSKAGMNLQGWCSNSQYLMNIIPSTKLTKEDHLNVNVLGLKWDAVHDTLSLKPITSDDSYCTKRSVLKLVSSIFDPAGLFTPVVLKGKLFIQRLWEGHFDWDVQLPEEYCREWENIKADVLKISKVSVPRYIGLPLTQVELHCFSDASTTCYATSIYLRVLHNGTSLSRLVFSKSHLAPIAKKSITVPRLELLGVLIGSRALKFVRNNLGCPVVRQFLWTDSQCVLHWLNTSKILPKFVDRRISEIKSNSDLIFRYVPSGDNPSDIATRGLTVDELQSCKLWWTGPLWLQRHEDQWPEWTSNPSIESEKEDINEELVSLTKVSSEISVELPFGIDINRFSTLNKLLRVTAYCHRFVLNCKKQLKGISSSSLTTQELQIARLEWEKYIQKKDFSHIFHNIQNKKMDSLQKRLKLVIDDNGLLRCSSRLLNADMPFDFKFPILLPKNNHFTDLIIEDFHTSLLHVGVQHTLAEIRKRYWILSGRSQVYKTLKRCLTCVRWEGGPFKVPQMPPLPKERVTEHLPFTHTGLDYFGPLYIKEHRNKNKDSLRKVYGCIFTCLTTRAIHLELVNDLTTEEFLLCFRRFISRRGKPTKMFLDNAPQFKLTATFLEEVWRNNFKDQNVLSYIHKVDCEFHFIPELSPWMGGFYERLISLVKRCLRKTIGSKVLTFSQLETTMTEVEAVVNSRPLVYVSSNEASLDDYILTPGHFLNFHGKNGNMSNYGNRSTNKSTESSHNMPNANLLEAWKKGQKLLNTFWTLWQTDYLASIRERNKTDHKQTRNASTRFPSTGDVVLIHDHLPRGMWRIGRICDLHVSGDKKIRSATITLSDGKKILRPLKLIYPLELNDKEEQTGTKS